MRLLSPPPPVHDQSSPRGNRETPVADYFRQFPGLDSGDGYNGAGFWELPVPVVNHLDVEEDDVVVWDDQGYDQLRDFLKGAGIRHCLMMGTAPAPGSSSCSAQAEG